MSRLLATVLAALALAAGGSAPAAEPAPPAPRKIVPRPPSAGVAPVALLVDVTTGQVLHAHEADRRFLPASVTKVMTAYVAFEMLASGRLSPRTVYTVNPATARAWSGKGTSLRLEANERVMLDDLLRGITTVSANDASVVLAEETSGSVANWVALMNAEARRLGMADSHFGTPNGWMDQGGTYVTARDLARLASAIFTRHPGLYRNYFGHREFTFGGKTRRNHDPISGVVPGADGIKTGFTNQAGYNFLGSGYRDGRRLVLVLAGFDRGSVRDEAARAYLEWGFTHFEKRDLFAQGEIVAWAKVQGGAARGVALQALRPIALAVPRGLSAKPKLSLAYQGPLEAPIRKGEQVAELVIVLEGMPETRIPLVAAREVAPANMAQRAFNGLVGLL